MGSLRFALLLLCFTLSGFAALVYQTAWSQELALVFGASQPAVAAVLAATMAGLAVGAAIAGRLEARITRPLVAYGLLELGIGVAALGVPIAVRGAGVVQRALLAGHAEDGVASTLFYLAAALLLLLIPNALMGATLPLVARRAVRSASELGPRVARLYAANTVGAAAGALVCAFVLIPRLGLGAAMKTAVAVSFTVGALALLLARGAEPMSASSPQKPAPALAGSGWVLPAILISGAVSFTYEVLWTRLLGHLLGGSIYAFGTMLASFLAGLAVGAALAAPWAREPEPARRAFAVAQLATAGVTLLAWAVLDPLPAWSTGALGGAALMFPVAVAIGASVPLAIRILARDAGEAGVASARVLAWNTTGSIVGALAGGFLLLPALGFAGTLTLAVALNLLLAVAAAIVARPRLRLLAGLAVLLAVILALLPPAQPWRVLRSSPIGVESAAGEAVFFAVGRSATVLALATGTDWRLTTDGMPEAAIQPPGARPGRQPITSWLSLLPLAARPEARSMLVIGLGGGSTLEEIPASVEEITVVEIEPEVVAANRRLAARRRRDPLADPRLRVVVNDARSFLRLAERRFDVIVSQPSHPWTSGASHLFTRELFELARARLEPGGVLVQWIGLSLVDPPALGSLLATLGSVFPHVETFCPYPGTAALFLASSEPLALDAAVAARAVETTPAWRELGVLTGDDLLLARVLDTEGGARFARDAPLNTDHHNLLEARSPWLVKRPATESLAEIEQTWGALDPLPSTVGIDRFYAVAKLLDEGAPARALRVAAVIADPLELETAFALAALARGDVRRGQAELLRLARADPGAMTPRRALIRFWQRELHDAPPPPVLEPLLAADPGAAAVVEGWRRLGKDDPTALAALAALDERLRAISARDLLYPAAVRLRIAWRQASGEPAHAREAIALLDPLLATSAPVQDLLLRARLGRAAGDDGVVLASLGEIAVAAQGRAALAPAAREALAILDELGSRAPVGEAARLRSLLEGVGGSGSD